MTSQAVTDTAIFAKLREHLAPTKLSQLIVDITNQAMTDSEFRSELIERLELSVKEVEIDAGKRPYNLTIETLIFGNYKKHFEASAKYEEARVRMDFLRLEIEQTGSKDLMLEYFECERTMKKSANDKRQASKQSINLFTYQEVAN